MKIEKNTTVKTTIYITSEDLQGFLATKGILINPTEVFNLREDEGELICFPLVLTVNRDISQSFSMVEDYKSIKVKDRVYIVDLLNRKNIKNDYSFPNGKIEAIKYVRNLLKVGLKDAKDLVEKIEDEEKLRY